MIPGKKVHVKSEKKMEQGKAADQRGVRYCQSRQGVLTGKRMERFYQPEGEDPKSF